jgi:predicted oxidoreductase
MWFDAVGRRLPAPLFPGFDTLATLAHLGRTGHGHSWFVLNRRIIGREFALSGSDQNPDITGRRIPATLRTRLLPSVPAPIQRFIDQGPDFVVAATLEALVGGMNRLTGDTPHIELESLHRQLVERDREVLNPYGKDLQIAAIRAARRYLPDRLTRVVAPHAILDPAAGPLIAVRLRVLTRKTLGGLATDLEGQVLGAYGRPIAGLYAAGEAAGFGGGGMHGHNALEGTFLGGCLFSGRVAGRAIAARL